MSKRMPAPAPWLCEDSPWHPLVGTDASEEQRFARWHVPPDAQEPSVAHVPVAWLTVNGPPLDVLFCVSTQRATSWQVLPSLQSAFDAHVVGSQYSPPCEVLGVLPIGQFVGGGGTTSACDALAANNAIAALMMNNVICFILASL
jgi:hypothetical protein